MDELTDLTGRPAAVAKPRVGRRIPWHELYRQRPDLRPANDNLAVEHQMETCGISRASMGAVGDVRPAGDPTCPYAREAA